MITPNKQNLAALAALRASSGLVLTARATGPECVPAAQFQFISDNGNETGFPEMDCTQIFEVGFAEEEPPLLGEQHTERLVVDVLVSFVCAEHESATSHNWHNCHVEVRRRVPVYRNRFRYTSYEGKMGLPLVQSNAYTYEQDGNGPEKILTR